jgi:hypothetical protein
MRRFLLFFWALPLACLTPVAPPYQPVYHNPLDLLDGGQVDGGDGGDAGPPDAGPVGPTNSNGTVDGRGFNLSSAIVQVMTDGGAPSASIWLADVSNLCAEMLDGGLSVPWNLLQIHLAGDSPGTYPVATILPPGGATGRFDWQEVDHSFGFERASAGTLLLFGIDSTNLAPAIGDYQLDFGDAGSLSGHFEAEPCPVVPGTP